MTNIVTQSMSSSLVFIKNGRSYEGYILYLLYIGPVNPLSSKVILFSIISVIVTLSRPCYSVN